jgi:hypothetical protein
VRAVKLTGQAQRIGLGIFYDQLCGRLEGRRAKVVGTDPPSPSSFRHCDNTLRAVKVKSTKATRTVDRHDRRGARELIGRAAIAGEW